MERGRIHGLPNFLSTPYYLRAYPWTAQFFEYPLLYQERVKLRNSNFVRTFLVSIGTKVHYKFLEKQPGA